MDSSTSILSVIVSNENNIIEYDVKLSNGNNESYTDSNVPDSIIHFINHTDIIVPWTIKYKGEETKFTQYVNPIMHKFD